MSKRPYPLSARTMDALHYGDMDPKIDMPLAQPAYRRREKATYQERFIFCSVQNADIVKDWAKPPPQVEAAFEEILGRDHIHRNGRVHMCVRLHPVLKRWCVYERRLDPGKGENYWQVIMPVWEDVPEGDSKFLPSDIRALPSEDRQFVEHLAGLIGEYKLPDSDDFAALRSTSKRDHTAEEIEAAHRAREKRAEMQHRSWAESFDHDTVSYLGNLYADQMNREAGSGWHMRSVDGTVKHKEDDRYYIEQREGYRLRVKKLGQEKVVDHLSSLLRGLPTQISADMARDAADRADKRLRQQARERIIASVGRRTL